MRAPDDTKVDAKAYRTFTEVQWQAVKNSLTAVNPYLDADVLRGSVEDRAYLFVMVCEARPLTSKQATKEWRERVTALEQAFALLDPKRGYPGLPADRRDLAAKIKRRRALRGGLLREIAEHMELIAKLEAVGSSSKNNARTVLRGYWETLLELWLPVATVSKNRRKHLQTFLCACSRPLLPLIKTKNGQRLSEEDFERQAKNFADNVLSRRAT
jgi:hypothetical protein